MAGPGAGLRAGLRPSFKQIFQPHPVAEGRGVALCRQATLRPTGRAYRLSLHRRGAEPSLTRQRSPPLLSTRPDVSERKWHVRRTRSRQHVALTGEGGRGGGGSKGRGRGCGTIILTKLGKTSELVHSTACAKTDVYRRGTIRIVSASVSQCTHGLC